MTVQAFIVGSTEIMLSAGKKLLIKILRAMILIKEKYSLFEFSLKICTLQKESLPEMRLMIL